MMSKSNPVFVPADMAQLDQMVGGLSAGLNKHFKFNPNSQQKLRDVVLSALLFNDGVQEWQGILNQKLDLPAASVCDEIKAFLPEEFWVATDPNLEYLAIYFKEPENVESCGDASTADLVIFNSRDAYESDADVGTQPTESNHWAYIANTYRVDEMTVVMPSISKYGVSPTSTDAGGIEFLKDTLWLQHINDEMCIDPVDRQDDGSDNIWLKLTRI